MRKVFIGIFIFIALFFLSSCSVKQKDSVINSEYYHEIFVGEEKEVEISSKYEIRIINDDVIKYEDGRVKGLKPGVAFIQLLSKDKEKERIEVLVKSGKYDGKVDELTISNEYHYLTLGEIREVQTSKEVTITSLTPGIVKVIDGKFLYGAGIGLGLISIDGKEEIILVTNTDDYSDIEKSTINVSEKAMKQVVTVFNYQKGTNYEYALYASGSGVVYKVGEEDIFILTNRHVVLGSEALFVYFSAAKEKVYARIVAYDDMVDLAVIAVKKSAVSNLDEIDACQFGYFDDIKVGQFAMTVGSPIDFELEGAVCLGIVSKKEVYFPDDNDEDGQYEYYNKYMQVDASINSGNSGGPLYNLKGQVIGISTAKIDSSISDNLGFVIPTDIIMLVLDRLENASKIKYKSLGISCYSIDILVDYDYSYNIGENRTGVIVTDVLEDSIADRCGILEDDIITKYDDIDITSAKVLLVAFFNDNIKGKDEITLTIIRDNEEIKVTINLNEEE